MADKRIVEIELKSNTSAENKIAEKYDGTLKSIAKTTKEINSSKSATRTGSRAADAALGVSEPGSDRGLRRGTTGAGGRGAERDFARQAQGLGGLVHLYATFAANIYAVSAAFTALSKAADFERMEKSAERMSVVLGINLNSAAKAMVNLTDGAVSYAEAIEKTNLAASAGLSTKQISDLTKVAKGASTALGRDMGDSLNRLVKGTVKLEPELLDELGILTKASEAYSVYSASIGKSADSLTKFEKTQAFVNAVIAEGDSKFSSLYNTVEANPYTKIQASIENLGKESLGVLNTALSPIVNFLSQSPTGLAAAIGLVVGKLAKLAMPELLAGLATRVTAASEALNKSSANFKTANEAVFKSFENTVGYASISSNSKSKILKEASSLRKQLNDSILTDFELSGTGPVQYSAQTSKLIADYEKKLENYRNRLAGRKDQLGSKALSDLNNIERELSLLKDMKKSYADLADNEQIAGSARNKENKATLDYLKANRSLRVAELVMDGQHLAALKTSYGLQVQITQEKLKQIGLDKVPLVSKVGGAIGGVVGAAGTALMSFATILPTITMVVGALSAVYEGIKWIAGEAKSMGALEAAVDGASDAHKILNERLLKLGMLTQSARQDTEAYAKAQHLAGTTLNSYADSLETTYESLRKVQAEIAGGAKWTQFTNWIGSLFGSDILVTTSESMAKDIMGALSIAIKSGDNKLKKSIAESLRIDEADLTNIYKVTAAVKDLNDKGNVFALTNIQRSLQEVGRESLNAESRLRSVEDALRSANKEAGGIDAKRVLNNPKYEELYNTVQMISKVSNETEKSKLFSKLFSGMSDDLRSELGVINKDLKNFFDSPEFKQDQMVKAFDLTETGQKFKSVVDNMKNDAYLFFTDLRNFSTSSGIGWNQQGGKSVQAKEGNMITLLESAKNQQANAEAYRQYLLDNVDTFIQTYADNLGKKELSNTEVESAKAAIQKALDNEVEAIKNYIIDLTSIGETRYKSTAEAGAAVLQASDRFNKTTSGAPSNAAQKALETAVPKLSKKSDVQAIGNFPKDRLQKEKAYSETLARSLKLEESKLALTDEELKLYGDTLGIAGKLYDSLIDQKNAQLDLAFEAKKKYEEDKLSLDFLIRKEAVRNDKNISNKEAEIARIKELFEEDQKILANTLKADKQRIDLQKDLNDLKKIEQSMSFASSLTALAQAGKPLSENLAMYGKAAEYAKIEEEALKSQLVLQQRNTKQLEKQAGTAEYSAKSVLESKRQELEITNKLYEVAKANNQLNLKTYELTGNGSLTDYLTNAANQFGYVFREQLKASKGTMVTLVDGLVAGLNSSIDELFVQIQEGTLNMKDMATFASNAFSNAFRDAAAQSIKDFIANSVSSLLNPNKQTLETTLTTSSETIRLANTSLQGAIEANTQAILQKTPGTGTDLGDKALDTTENAAKTQEEAAKDNSNAGKTFLKASDAMFLAGAALMAFQGKWEQAAMMILGQILTALATSAVTGGTSGGGMWGSIFKGVAGMFTGGASNVVGPVISENAKGGIVGQYGPVQLAKYSKGGVATSPQLSLFGEGSKNEAYVPLPDNRSIPVTLSGESTGGVSIGDTTINVTVDSSNGNSSVDVQGNAEMAKSLGLAIKKTVHEELINQARPGGMFYRG